MDFKQRPHQPVVPRRPTQQSATKAPAGKVEDDNSVKTVEIKLSLPKLPKNLPKVTVPSWQTIRMVATKAFHKLPKKKLFIVVAVIIALIVGYFATLSLMRQWAIFVNGGSGQMVDGADKILQAPDYTTILPEGQSINQLGGWKRVSPPKGNPVFAYSDKINGTPISVSQQPLPDTFKTDTDLRVSELAKDYSATEKINAAGTTIYIGTSAKGPQSAIFIKKDVLVLIKAQAKIDNKAWGEYADSLK